MANLPLRAKPTLSGDFGARANEAFPSQSSTPARSWGQVPTPTGTAPLCDLLTATSALIEEFLAAEHDLPSPDLRHQDQLRQRLNLELGVSGLPTSQVLDRIHEVLRATPSTSSPRFLNQLFGGREALATVAEMLTAVANTSMYTFKAAGAQVLVENEVLRRMAAAAGFAHGEGTFTPGGSLANLVALVLARDHALPTARDQGLDGRKVAIYTSAEGHYSIPKNVGVLGFGRRQLRSIPVDHAGRMDPHALEQQLRRDRRDGALAIMVNATAGTTVRGAFDPIRPIVEVAHEYGAWVHVDGALGGSLLLSSRFRHLLDGMELADSLSWNPHKMMGVPLQASVLLTARRGALAGSLDESAEYLFQVDDRELNPGHRSLQCGRRNDALKLWAAWLHLGDAGWERRLERQMALAQHAARLIAADPELELIEEPPSINVNFEVRGISSEAICDLLDREGRLKIGFGRVGDRTTIRLVCVNPELGELDLDSILAEIKAAAALAGPGA